MRRCVGMLLMSCAVWTANVEAQDFPRKPVRLIAPFAPGGATDLLARLVSQKLSDRWGQSVLVDNRTGAGGIIAAEILAKSPPDGHTIFACTTGNFAIQPFLYKTLPFNPDKDLVPVTQTGSLPYIIVVHPSLPVKNVKELIAFAKSHPGQINYASSGIGSASHLSPEMFKSMAGINIVHVPYKGTGQAIGDLLAGQVVMMFDQPVSTLPHVKAGKLRVLAITSGKRFPTLQEIPTVAESGIPGFEAVSWAGVCAPGGTSKEIVNRLQGEVAKVLKLPDVSERLMRDGIEPIGSTPEQFHAFIEREKIKWSKVVKDSGARAD